MPFSVVIITYNEERHISDCINSVLTLTNDIVVIDAESTDKTIEVANALGARTYSKSWEGYSQAKNYGNTLAKYEWILSIDADEIISQQLAQSLLDITLQNNCVYAVKRTNYIGQRALRYSHIHPEWKNRLFEKEVYSWNHFIVHEKLQPDIKNSIRLTGELMHYQASDIDYLRRKYQKYAILQRQASSTKLYGIKRLLAPAYHFLRSYIVMGGILEGRLGYQLAREYMVMTKNKYVHHSLGQAK